MIIIVTGAQAARSSSVALRARRPFFLQSENDLCLVALCQVMPMMAHAAWPVGALKQRL